MTRATERFVPVPADFACYETDVRWAARVLDTGPDHLETLAANGFPHADDPERGPLFDHVDLMNLAMYGAGNGQTIPDLAIRFLLRFADADPRTWYEPREWRVRVRPPKHAPAGLTAQEYRISRPDVTAPGIQAIRPAVADGVGFEVVVRITGAPASIQDRQIWDVYAELVDALNTGTVVYQAVPERLRMRHATAWELGMADCVVTSRLLAERLRAAGHTARARRGYLLGLVGSDHAWCEVYEDGAWKPVDVVFASLAGTQRFDASASFVAACGGGRFNRLLPCQADDAVALVAIDDEPAPPWALAGVSCQPWSAG